MRTRLLPVCLLASVSIGCGAPPRTTPAREEMRGSHWKEALDIKGATLGGRQFVYTRSRRSIEDPFSDQTVRFVAVSLKGDNRRFSITADDQGPPSLKVTADALILNGHEFRVTDTPGLYVLDGKPVSMAEGPLLHCIYNGKYGTSLHP